MPRLLFCSYHSWLDPSSGAALAVRDLLELLAGVGWDCRVLCGPQIDFPAEEPIDQLLSDQHLAYETRRWEEGPAKFTLWHYRVGAIPSTTYRPDARATGVPSAVEGEPFLALLERTLTRFQPHVVLTYGGSWLGEATIAQAKKAGARVVFYLLNFGYRGAALFRLVDAVLVPSRFSAEHYRRTLGLDCTALPLAINWNRVRCAAEDSSAQAAPAPAGVGPAAVAVGERIASSPQFVTFVNPQPEKGLFVFARIAETLGRQRPDIPLLVVEGRAKANLLSHTGVDLRSTNNLHVMANTPDPRDFYRVTRIVLMPSLWNESFGRVAAEAAINGIPVLASNRGALPEVMREAGLLLDIPSRYTSRTRSAPTKEEVAPWVETTIRLWDDPAFYRHERERCLAASQTWHPGRLAEMYHSYFQQIATCG